MRKQQYLLWWRENYRLPRSCAILRSKAFKTAHQLVETLSEEQFLIFLRYQIQRDGEIGSCANFYYRLGCKRRCRRTYHRKK